ncbi:Gmad2 immunoglobulin-like domain-containing protein [Micromonospora sp. NPDC052213]|uniref:Gmad2 immunoglobulin-like domain-containing protein n=1 Tax=Micromonospora sp. NPDC052213 TaxID=3155812 RepID=UPI003435B530
MSRRAAAVALLAAALLPAGCAAPRSGSLGPAPTAPPPVATPSASAPPPSSTAAPPTAGPVRSPTPAATAAAPTRAQTVTVELWYVRDGRLAPTRRTRPATVATSRLALTELAAGPTPAEAATGLTTLLPAGGEVTRIADGVATVAPAPAGGDAPTRRLREAQVVYTLTQFPTVERVRLAAGPPVGRADYADLLPPVVVTGPTIGARVGSPVTVTGSADVFEATVTVRVLDAAGRTVATTFTTATCGTGCRGDFRVTVAYRVQREQPGTIEAYEVSAADGTRRHVVAVPVTLTPVRS